LSLTDAVVVEFARITPDESVKKWRCPVEVLTGSALSVYDRLLAPGTKVKT